MISYLLYITLKRVKSYNPESQTKYKGNPQSERLVYVAVYCISHCISRMKYRYLVVINLFKPKCVSIFLQHFTRLCSFKCFGQLKYAMKEGTAPSHIKIYLLVPFPQNISSHTGRKLA